MSSEPIHEHERALAGLSALGDGESSGPEVKAAVDAWRRSPELRAAWHRYALIGDVLRSEELASTPDHDEAFLTAFRSRLAAEPVVLAPAVAVAMAAAPANGTTDRSIGVTPAARRFRAATMATAASVMVMAGAALVWRGLPESGSGAAVLANAATPAASGAELVLVDLNVGQMQRSPELDRYLSAHRQFSPGPALAAPGGVRQVAVTPDAR
ncbi:sigma-E factor negative regulatory protein [Ideonella sp.]|uniref:sigma-E factor negative regulatory protein n=1 Tax=Ideonella sp. TaxID=1929293 RepID=UPI003BB7C660